MNAAAHALRKTAAKPSPEPARRSAGSPSKESAAAATPRYLQASLKLGGVNDPEEHEAEHAARVVASGGCYGVIDPGGSSHLRAASADEAHAHEPVRKTGVDHAGHETARWMTAPAAHEPVRKTGVDHAAHEPARRMTAPAAHETT